MALLLVLCLSFGALFHGFSPKLSSRCSSIHRFNSERQDFELNESVQSAVAKPTRSIVRRSLRQKIQPVVVVEDKTAAIHERNAWLWKVVYLGVTILYSTNYAVFKEIIDAVPGVSPSSVSAARFMIAALVVLPWSFGYWRNSKVLKMGAVLGLCSFLGYFGQAQGLVTSTADKASFICSMNVVWVSFLTMIKNKSFRVQTWVSVGLAMGGAATLELSGSATPCLGDLWLFLQPIGFGTGYVILGDLMKEGEEMVDSKTLTAFMLLVIGTLTTTQAVQSSNFISDLTLITQSPVAMAGVLWTSVVTTALMLYLQGLAFKHVSATDASMILTTEPVWAACVATALLHEDLSPSDIIGGLLLLSASVCNELNVVDRLMQQFKLGQWANE